MKMILLVGLGGFIGSVLRFLLADHIQTKSLSTFPYGTLSVNVIGCFVIGLIFGLVEKNSFSLEVRYFLAAGLVGGFTTFSAFSYETFLLMREGQIGQATVYVLSSILLGFVATMLGFQLFRLFNF